VHRLVAQQIAKATDASGAVNIDRLAELVGGAYSEQDRDRRRTDRSIALMIDEIDAINRGLEQTVAERTQQLREREADLQAQNVLFNAALSNMSQGLLMFDRDMRLVMHNERYAEMYRLRSDEVPPGTSLRELLEISFRVNLFSGDAERSVAAALALFEDRAPASEALELADGRTIAVTIQPMPDGGWVTTHEDITERRHAEIKIAHMAHHDALTDLPNRVMLNERLGEALANIERGQQLAVLCLDLDRFKNVNDTLGHPVGDALLRKVAGRLRNCVDDMDTISRVGGDEFSIIQTNIAGAVDAEQLAMRIFEAISAPYDLDGHQVSINTSIGIALAPADGTKPDELLKNADMALYGAKGDGRGMFRFFESEMDARMKARRILEIELRRAVENGEFILHYQPVVNLSQDDVKSCEALLRWRHPERGIVSPLEFIPVAEEIGLIVPIGEWVIRRACEDAAKWSNHIGVAVNLSPTQLGSKNLLPTVLSALAKSGLPPSRLEMEITEAVLMQNTETTLKTLHQLRSLGIRISMDDFGTGYSSLSYLRSFPFDRIKIDRCFINDLGGGSESAAIVKAVTALAESLGMKTTAEGVETEMQLDQVRELGCTDVQGYFYSKPLPVEQLTRMFSAPPPREKGRRGLTSAIVALCAALPRT
jgi:diguanylate cyclase (GGDEF)-like protein